MKPLIVVILWAAGLLSSLAAVSNPPARDRSPYCSQTWQTRDGLPNNSVQALAQTHDGYLWIGTASGLARFNGFTFFVVDIPDIGRGKNASITALAQGTDGSLWIGTRGNGLFCLKEDRFSSFTQTNGLPDNSIRTLFVAHDGTLWAGTSRGAIRIPKEITPMLVLTNVDVATICEDRDNRICFGLVNGIFRLDQFGKLKSVSTNAAEWTSGTTNVVNARALCRDHNGDLWAGAGRRLVRLGTPPRQPYHSTTLNGLAHAIVSLVAEDRRGNVWIGTYGGLNQLPAGRESMIEITSNGEPFDRIQAWLEDREGNIWIGTKEGLALVRPQPFFTYARGQGLSHNTVMSVLEDRRHRIWVGTGGGGLNYFENGIFKTVNEVQGRLYLDIGHNLVPGIALDHNDCLWFTADNSKGLFFVREDNLLYRTADVEFNDRGARVIREDRSGNLWLGTLNGLSMFDGQRFKQWTAKDGLNGNAIRDLHEDSAGRLWVASDQGLNIVENGKITNVFSRIGVLSMCEDVDGKLWLGTRAGIRLFANGRLLPDRPESDPVFSESIWGIAEDDAKNFWLSSGSGIYSIPRKTLEAACYHPDVPLKSIAYDTGDGLLSANCGGVAQPASWKATDGRLWFATAKGVAVVDPRIARERNTNPPPVVIEEIVVDKQSLDPRQAILKVRPGRGELEFHYTTLSFSGPEKNRFKYRLEGLDTDWKDAGIRRAALYNNVPPGDYSFRVIACNNDGVWNHVGATVRFTLEPHLWQTSWFKIVVALSCLSAVALAVRYATRYRMKRALERLEQAHAIERERTRIAQDMHDDLGARLTEILLASNRARARRDDSAEIDAYTARMLKVARDLSENMSALVWAVNPRNDSLERFIPFVCEYAQSFLDSADIRCRLDIPDDLPELKVNSELRHNLFLVAKEALNNALKHAKASEVRLGFKVDQRRLSIVIIDNGIGFERSNSRDVGNGLLNMDARIRKMGGCFTIEARSTKELAFQ